MNVNISCVLDGRRNRSGCIVDSDGTYLKGTDAEMQM